MICVNCNTDSKYKDRFDGKCSHCHKPFVFEPQKGDRVTDKAFKAAIDAVSPGRVMFGVESVYYEVCRKLAKKAPRNYLPHTMVAALGSLVVGVIFLPWMCLGIFVAPLGLLIKRKVFVSLTSTEFRPLWQRWVKVHGEPSTLIHRLQSDEPVAVEADLQDYSFDRAVICDRARTVDLLLANHFHFENSCAILGVEGYPARPFKTVKAMLMRNPKLKVYALHDCTPDGCALAKRLRTDPEWFGASKGVKVIDVGIRPAQAQNLHGCYGERDVSSTFAMTRKEAAFFAECTVELAAVRPERILKALFRAMNPKTSAKVGVELENIGELLEDVVEVALGQDDDGGGTDFNSDSDGDGGADSFG